MNRDIAFSFPPLPNDGEKRFLFNSTEWWEWFRAFRRKPSENSIYRRLSEYGFFISFHGARPSDVASYHANGIALGDVNALNHQAKQMLISGRYPQITAALVDEAIAKASTIHDKTLFLVIDEREVSGHYMIYGSEHICGIAASMSHKAGIDCRQLLKDFGTPTQFRIALPRDCIPDDQLRQLAAHIAEFCWDERKRKHPPSIDWSLILTESIPGKYILDHVHPESIPDPLLRYHCYRYRENFPSCSELL